MTNYVLIGRTPVPEPDLQTWARWFEDTDNRRVAVTELGDCLVSTVFLGFDHNFYGKGPPLLFETMAFKKGKDIAQERCSTWAEAEEMHRRMVEHVTQSQKDGLLSFE